VGFCDHENFPHAGDVGPIAIELGNQPLHLVIADGALKRRRVK